MTVALANPADDAAYTFEWQDLPEGVQLSSVLHSVPAPLLLGATGIDVPSSTSTIRVRGGVHGALYRVEAEATLNTGEKLKRSFPLRILNG